MNTITNNINNNNILKEYKIEETIAQGTFGEIKLGIHLKTNQKVC